jgi:hypothetical protein
MNPVPPITVIIPSRPGQQEIKALQAAQRLEYPREKLEIIVARGRQPAVQRNAALGIAKGDLIYFLDDDSVPPPDNLKRLVDYFKDERVQMVGGPNVCPPNAPPLEQIFATVLSAWLAFGPSRARYTPVGVARASSEKELILCNLAARRKTILDLGGFDEHLYPNEENALMDTLQKQGAKLLYDPEFIVERRPRPTLRGFARMARTYGRGRAEQFRVNPTPGSALNFVPPAFCVYLACLAFLPFVSTQRRGLILLPLAAYGAAVILQTLALCFSAGPLRAMGALPLIILTHILYGVGFWRGLFTRLKKPAAEAAPPVDLERIC